MWPLWTPNFSFLCWFFVLFISTIEHSCYILNKTTFHPAVTSFFLDYTPLLYFLVGHLLGICIDLALLHNVPQSNLVLRVVPIPQVYVTRNYPWFSTSVQPILSHFCEAMYLTSFKVKSAFITNSFYLKLTHISHIFFNNFVLPNFFSFFHPCFWLPILAPTFSSCSCSSCFRTS